MRIEAIVPVINPQGATFVATGGDPVTDFPVACWALVRCEYAGDPCQSARCTGHVKAVTAFDMPDVEINGEAYAIRSVIGWPRR